MKTILIAALAVSALAATPALAGEGNGEPFPFRSRGITTFAAPQRADVGSAAYPDVRGRSGTFVEMSAGSVVPDTGTEAPIQTANSVPTGFTADKPSFAQLTGAQPMLTARKSIYLSRY